MCNLMIHSVQIISVFETFYNFSQKKCAISLNINNIAHKAQKASQAEGHGFESRCPLFNYLPCNLMITRFYFDFDCTFYFVLALYISFYDAVFISVFSNF